MGWQTGGGGDTTLAPELAKSKNSARPNHAEGHGGADLKCLRHMPPTPFDNLIQSNEMVKTDYYYYYVDDDGDDE